MNFVSAGRERRISEKGPKAVVAFLGMTPVDLSNEICLPSLAFFYASEEFNANG